MGMTIWKTVLSQNIQEIRVPKDAEMLCAREQYNEVCVWYRCDPTAEKEFRSIALIATGGSAPLNGRYLGTAMLHGGTLVLHAFEYEASNASSKN